MSRQAAHKAVVKTLALIAGKVAESADQVRQIEVETLNDLQAAIMPRATKAAAADYCTDGQDKAMDRVVRIMERRAKLLGLDAPTRNEHTVTVTAVIAAIKALGPDERREAMAELGAAEVHARLVAECGEEVARRVFGGEETAARVLGADGGDEGSGE
jgi:hypothetical protein